MKAVFLDRDGVINRNVYYPDSGAYESPRTAAEFELFPDSLQALQNLQVAGYYLFLVSNQPNAAKAKSTLLELEEVQLKFEAELALAKIRFVEFFYCYHHPDSNDPIYGGPCECRKPSPYFLKRAAADHNIDLNQSWLVGDRLTDVACGCRAGVRTVLIDPNNEHGVDLAIGVSPEWVVSNLGEATRYILDEMDGPALGKI